MALSTHRRASVEIFREPFFRENMRAAVLLMVSEHSENEVFSDGDDCDLSDCQENV